MEITKITEINLPEGITGKKAEVLIKKLIVKYVKEYKQRKKENNKL